MTKKKQTHQKKTSKPKNSTNVLKSKIIHTILFFQPVAIAYGCIYVAVMLDCESVRKSRTNCVHEIYMNISFVMAKKSTT